MAGLTDEERNRARLRQKLLTELGDVVNKALDDDDVTEVQLNPDGTLWIDGTKGKEQVGNILPNRALNIANTFAACLNAIINFSDPMLEGELSVLNGERLTVLVPPLVTATTFALRKHTSSKMSLDDWMESGGMTADQRETLKSAVENRLNIIVSGGTGTGKTTFVNAMLDELSEVCPDDRIVVIEDTKELRVPVDNLVSMTTSDEIGMAHLLRKALRLTPNRIVVGEVRGAEALTMLEAWNTGHPGGLATIHASDAPRAVVRLEQMCAAAEGRSERQIKDALDSAVDIIVQLRRNPDGTRSVAEILLRNERRS